MLEGGISSEVESPMAPWRIASPISVRIASISAGVALVIS